MKAPSCMGICIHSNGFCEDTFSIREMVNGHGKVDELMVQGFPFNEEVSFVCLFGDRSFR